AGPHRGGDARRLRLPRGVRLRHGDEHVGLALHVRPGLEHLLRPGRVRPRQPGPLPRVLPGDVPRLGPGPRPADPRPHPDARRARAEGAPQSHPPGGLRGAGHLRRRHGREAPHMTWITYEPEQSVAVLGHALVTSAKPVRPARRAPTTWPPELVKTVFANICPACFSGRRRQAPTCPTG